MKKLYYIFVLVFLIGLFAGCTPETKEITSSSFNGIYEYKHNKLYVVALDKDNLEFYYTDEYDNKNFGKLFFQNDIAKSDDFIEAVTLRLDDNKLIVDAQNIDNLSSGTYKKIKDYTIDKYYEDAYGLSKYYGSKYTGKFKNGKDTVYIYQPRENYVVFNSEIEGASTYCEIKLEDKNDLKCQIFDSEYTLKLDDNKLYYTAKYETSENYEGIFTKEGTLSKKEIIKNFEPFQASDEQIEIFEIE